MMLPFAGQARNDTASRTSARASRSICNGTIPIGDHISSQPNPREPRRDPVTAAIEAIGTLLVEQRGIALAAVLIEAGAITEPQLRTAVFRVSGNPVAKGRMIHATNL
jgi:hypothetical protein